MRIAFFGYRDWAVQIADNLTSEFISVDTESGSIDRYGSEKIDFGLLDQLNYDSLFFYGWSWIVPKEITDKFICVCLHPSPLPKYRGGTPLQHQIMAGETKSAVTLFRMTEKLDAGEIYYQKEFSLDGNMSDVLNRIVDVGTELSISLIQDFKDNKVVSFPQDESKVTFFKRRKPNYELKVEDIKKMTGRQIYNFLRCLQFPYPTAYLVGKDGKKVYLEKVSLQEQMK